MKCPNCLAQSGDDWTQCRGKCPMPQSPHYDELTALNVQACATEEDLRYSRALASAAVNYWNYKHRK